MNGRILIITCVYPPEPVVSARTSEEIADFLASRSYLVDVVAPYPSRPTGEYPKKFRGRFGPVCENNESSNLSVIRLRAFASRKSTLLSRFLENLSFGILSFFIILVAGWRYSAVYVNTWPLMAVFLAIVPAKLWRLRVVRSVQDLYPSSLVSQSRVDKNSSALYALTKFEALNYRLSTFNVFLSKEMRAQYLETLGIGELKDTSIVIPNWGRKVVELPQRGLQQTAANKALDLNIGDGSLRDWCTGSRLLVFGGNISVSSGLERILSNIPDLEELKLKLLIAGSGSELQVCETIVQNRGLSKSVRFLSPWPKELTVPVLSCADVFLLPTLPGQSINSLPSKLLDYMGLERPVLCVADEGSTLKNLFDEQDIGFCTTDTSEDSLKAVLREVGFAGLIEMQEKGKHARAYMDQNLTSGKWLPVLESALVRY